MSDKKYNLFCIEKTPGKIRVLCLEASPRLELGIRVLQTHALPLGYDATTTKLRQKKRPIFYIKHFTSQRRNK